MYCFCLVLFFVEVFLLVDCAEIYGRYSGKKSDELRSECSIKVKPCTPHEGSRVDGMCNNFRRPSRGSARGPYLRLLKSDYGHRGLIRKNRDHEPLPSARKVRTMIWSDGRVTDEKMFTRAAAHLLEFVHNDISILNGTEEYSRNRTNCCRDYERNKEDGRNREDDRNREDRRKKEDGRRGRRCEPIPVPSDDPYLRACDVRCMNFSRAETFQDLGCVSKEINPEQINYQTPLLDLSTIYAVNDEALKEIRRFEQGLLREEFRNRRYVPLNETRDVCFQNKGSSKVCYKFGYPEAGNFDLTTTTIGIFFYREHNRIARILYELNPCWKDDRLFKVARQINIATVANIFMYELLPALLGTKNMINFRLISEHVEFVTTYDEDTDPLVFAEYEIVRRFFRTFWDGRIKKYGENYLYDGEFSLSDTLYRQEILEEQTNFEDINRGTFYQRAGKIDDILDPDISEKFLAESFKAHDQMATDIQRGRDLGLRGYNSYRRLCGRNEAKKFEDLLDVISQERVVILKRIYKDLEDIDLLVGIMSEEFMPGVFVGPTLFCIMSKQLQVFRYSDRFWFERGKQVHSFTLPQLQEIRKTNMARIACDNAEGIKFIQPHALFNVGTGNGHIPCTHIPGIDLSKWKDDSCYKQPKDENRYEEQGLNDELIGIYDRDQFSKDQLGTKVLYPTIQKPADLVYDGERFKEQLGPIIYPKVAKTPDITNLYQFGQLLNHRHVGLTTFPKAFNGK